MQKVVDEISNIKHTTDQTHKSQDETITELKNQLQQKQQEINTLNDDIDLFKRKDMDNETKDDEREKLQYLLEEKNAIISNHASTLENMKATILKLRDNLQNTFDEVKVKNNEISKLKAELEKNDKHSTHEIEEQKVSLLSTVNSHLTAVGCGTPSKQPRSEVKKPTSSHLFKTIVDKIQNIKLAADDGENDQDTENALDILKAKNLELNNELRDSNEKLAKKDKELMLVTKQKETLRAQLGSAVELMNSRENDIAPSKNLEANILPSIQSQLQSLQDESKQSEVTRDVTEQLMESFELNERKIAELVSKVKQYKEKIKEQRIIIKSIKRGSPKAQNSAELQEKLAKELKLQIRKEEVEKRDKEIERQRELLSSKSEQQTMYLSNKIEELEAKYEGLEEKYEAKDNEVTDLLIKLQENESEIERLKKPKERKSIMSLEDQLDDLTNTPVKENKSKGYDNQMKVLGKVEKLDEKIIELGEKIGEFRVELLDKFENEIDELNDVINKQHIDINKGQITPTLLQTLGQRAVEKLKYMKETNTVIQVVRKLETEGFSWLLLEKKDPLDKPLELKNSHSLSKSSIENQPGGRKLFWV